MSNDRWMAPTSHQGSIDANHRSIHPQKTRTADPHGDFPERGACGASQLSGAPGVESPNLLHSSLLGERMHRG